MHPDGWQYYREKEALINRAKANTRKNATLEMLPHDLAAPLALLQQLTEHLTWELARPSDKIRELLRLRQHPSAQG